MLFGGLEFIFLGKLLGLAAAGVTVAVVARAVLHRAELWHWFQSKKATLQQNDGNKLGVIIRKAMDDGKVSVVQGVFDTETDQVLARQSYVAEKLDDDLADTFNDNDVVMVKL